jgi:hypothetical protein
MRFKVLYNPDFFNDLIQAVDWYNEQQLGLGDRFYKSVKKKTTKLSTTALQFAVRYVDIRCTRIDKFPYLMHYRVDIPTKTKS